MTVLQCSGHGLNYYSKSMAGSEWGPNPSATLSQWHRANAGMKLWPLNFEGVDKSPRVRKFEHPQTPCACALCQSRCSAPYLVSYSFHLSMPPFGLSLQAQPHFLSARLSPGVGSGPRPELLQKKSLETLDKC